MLKTVFLDMDGVLADFITPAMAFHGAKFDAATYPALEWNTWKVVGCTEEEFWKFDCFEFWRDLPIYPWAKTLVSALESRVGADRICLLTNPSDHPECKAGKDAWIAMHLPRYSRQVLFGKPKWFCAHPSTVLIDDSDANCEAFAKEGGHIITFPRVWNAFGERANPDSYTAIQLDHLFERYGKAAA